MIDDDKSIPALQHKKGYNRAERIVSYLAGVEEGVTLTETEKNVLDICSKIHGYRTKFMSKDQIANVVAKTENIQKRQVYNLIIETEKIFGSVGKVHKDYERQFLLTASLKNIELAMESKNSTMITKALMAHYKIAGLEEFIPEMPDFNKLEQHQYFINLPMPVVDLLRNMVGKGAINLKDIVPPPNINLSGIEEATASEWTSPKST